MSESKATRAVLETLSRTRLLAVIRQDDLSHAEAVATALLDAGVKVQEFTLTNPDSLDAIGRMRRREAFGGAGGLVGAGSVRSVGEAHQALEAGAQFVVTPVMDLKIIAVCKEAGVPVFPGAFTPTEIHAAWRAGAEAVKVFPATTLGPGYIKDVLAPLPYLKLIPTGGVNLLNITAFLDQGAFAVGTGSSLLNGEALRHKDWEGLTTHARAFVKAAEAAEAPETAP